MLPACKILGKYTHTAYIKKRNGTAVVNEPQTGNMSSRESIDGWKRTEGEWRDERIL